MKTSEIRKGMKVQTNQLGPLVSGIMMDNCTRQYTRVVDVKGSSIGMFDEMGSVYSFQIVYAQDEKGKWRTIQLTDKEKKMEKDVKEWEEKHLA